MMNLRTPLFSCLTALTLAFFQCGFISGATQAEPIREIVSKLRQFHNPPEQEPNVPPPVARNLAALKHRLRDLIVEVAGAPGAAATDPRALQAHVIARLETEDIPIEDGDAIAGENSFGAITGIDLRRPPEFPNWLIATTVLSIPYGSDTSLYLFEIQGNSWKHALTMEANGYSQISGAQGWLEYFIPPANPGTKPFLVTADITPSAASVWQTLRITALRPGATPQSPLILARRSLFYCLDESYYFSMKPNGFGLIYLGDTVDRELAGWRGVHYLEYAVDGNRAVVVKETALDPYNAVLKWTAQDLAISSGSVEPSTNAGLRDWHERFRREAWNCGLGQIQLAHQTRGDRDMLLAAAPCSQGEHTDVSAYVLFGAGRDGFRIISISKTNPLPDERSGDSVYNAGGPGLTDPIPERIIQPKLPPGMLPATGTSVQLGLQVVVNEDGTIGSVSVPNWPEDDKGIVVPAIRAVRGWKYKPGREAGRAVKVSMPVTVVFEP